MRLIDASLLHRTLAVRRDGGIVECIDGADLDAAPTISCETCIHGDRATLNGEPTNEPNVYCGVTCLWWESFAGCSRWEARHD